MSKFYRTADRTVLLELFGPGESVENLKSLKANTTDAAVEKHVPVVTQEGNKVTVVVSSVEHPMLPEHYIMGVYIETKNGGQLHKFQPGDKPEAITVNVSEVSSVSVRSINSKNSINLQTTQKPKYIDLVFDKDGKIKKY